MATIIYKSGEAQIILALTKLEQGVAQQIFSKDVTSLTDAVTDWFRFRLEEVASADTDLIAARLGRATVDERLSVKLLLGLV